MQSQAHAEQLMVLFQGESLQGLDALAGLLANTSGSADAEEMFRILHTLRGSSAMQGLDDIAAWALQLELLFDQVRSGQRPLDEPLRAVTLSCIDGLRWMVQSPGQPLSESLQACSATLLDLANATPGSFAAEQPAAPDAVDVTLPVAMPDCESRRLFWISFEPNESLMRRGVDVLALLQELADLGDLISLPVCTALPALSAMDPEGVYLQWRMLLRTTSNLDEVQDIFMFVAFDSRVEVTALPDDGDTAQDELRARLQRSTCPAEYLSLRLEQIAGSASSSADDAFVPDWQTRVAVPVARLNHQIDLLGELVIAQSALAQVAAAEKDVRMLAAIDQVLRVTEDMRTNAMSLRRVPVRHLLDSLQSELETSAQSLDCSLGWCVKGSESELDIVVLSELHAPLLAWLRALLPGAAGGELGIAHVLTAHNEHAEWFVELNGVSGALPSSEALRRAVEELGGLFQCETLSETSYALMMRLPLAQGIIEGLLIGCAGEHYVLPMNLVEEVVDLHTAWSQAHTSQDVLDIRGRAVPFVRLAHLFGLTEQVGSDASTQPAQEGHVLILRHGDIRAGMQVNKVIGQQKTVIKRMRTLEERDPYISGATILADGRVALVLDVIAILNSVSEHNA